MSDTTSQRPGAYDRISAAYDLIAEPAEHEARARGLALLDAQRGERILDVGAGSGGALPVLGALVGDAGLVCGLDAAAGMLARARQRCCGFPITLQRGDARILPYREGSFDAAFTSFTLELFDPPDVARVLAEIRRVLGVRGRLAVVALDRSRRPNLATSAYGWLHDRFPHWIDCRPIEVLSVLRREGYETARSARTSLWGLPVMTALAFPRRSPTCLSAASPLQTR